MWGIDRLSNGELSELRKRLRGGGVAALTHAAAVNKNGRDLIGVLDELGVHPTRLFSPEHGMAGAAQAEEAVATPDTDDGPKLISLYGEDKASLKPRPEDLDGIDVLVIDLVDVGSRYYTYVWTALLAARAAHKAGVHTVVLDRPNPLSGSPSAAEGKAQAEGFTSFVGLEPIPIRHSLTIGELLAYVFARDEIELGKDGALSVVSTRGWERHQTAHAWSRPFSPPSPNMPSSDTALVYPGGCLVEGTNLSEGRGTTLPFRLVGAPFLNAAKLCADMNDAALPGVEVRTASFKPSFEKHAGEMCHGVFLTVTHEQSFRPVATYLSLLSLAQAQAPEQFAFRTETYEFESEIPAFDLLTGSAAAREAMVADCSAEDLIALVAPVDPSWSDTILEAESRLRKARA